MNLVDEKIIHHSFGIGRVISVENGYIAIRFEERYGLKRFCYPDAFEQYLKMCNESKQGFVDNDLQILLKKNVFEQAERERRYVEETERIEEEKKILKLASKAKAKTAAKSKSPKSTKTTKTVKVVKTTKTAKAAKTVESTELVDSAESENTVNKAASQ